MIRTATALALVLSLCACGEGDNPAPGGVSPDEAAALNDAAAMLDENSVSLNAADTMRGETR